MTPEPESLLLDSTERGRPAPTARKPTAEDGFPIDPAEAPPATATAPAVSLEPFTLPADEPTSADDPEAEAEPQPNGEAGGAASPAQRRRRPRVRTEPRTTPGFSYQAPRPALDHKLSTGVDRLDALLGGGYTPGCATLLFGPAFCGKQQLQNQSIVRAARDGIPVTLILHTIGAQAMSARLKALDPSFAMAEAAGLVRYVDVHSRFLGEPEGHPNTVYIEDPHDLPGILEAIQPKRSRRSHGAGLLAIESASTLLIDLGATKAFTFLRIVLGRTLTSGGVGLVCLEGGMHPESEIQMAKHLCAGMIEMRKKGEAHCLHVEGLETAYARPGWIEYEFNSRQFKVTGSFASRTIR